MISKNSPHIFSYGRLLKKNIYIVVGLVIFLIIFGSVGYYFIEGWPATDSIYMTIITISTVGLGEVRQLTQGGKVFTIFIIIAGVSIWAYALSAFSQLLIEGEVSKYFTLKRAKKMISKLTDHTILCGFGRIGQIAARELYNEKTPFLVIENNPTYTEDLKEKNYLHLIGDATNEDVLKNAGIDNARCLLSALGTDASNVYTVLIARELNPKLYIVGRSEDANAESNIIRAGADHVISPYRIGARSLAQAAIKPHVLNFIEVATSQSSMELAIEEITVPGKSPLAGQTLLSAKIRERFGVIVVGSKTRNQDMIFNPPADYKIIPGEVLIAIGKQDHLSGLRKAIRG